MALEDLTGPSKYLNALVIGNPVSDDDRREGDDHIRGLKNVLRNQFPNLDGAVTLTDEQMNALANLNTLALLKANNLSDLASAITARVNLGLQDAAGHLTPAAPTTTALPAMTLLPLALEQGLRIDTADESGAAAGAALVTRSVSASLALQCFIAHNLQHVQIGNARAGGNLELWAGTIAKLILNGTSGTARNSMQGPLDVFNAAASSLVMHQPTSTSYAGIRIYNDLDAAARALEIDYTGSAYGGVLVTGGPAGEQAGIGTNSNFPMVLYANAKPVVLCQDGLFYVYSRPNPGDNSNRVADTAFVNRQVVAGVGTSWFDVTASRAINSSFQNGQNRPVGVFTQGVVNGNGSSWLLQVGPATGGPWTTIGGYQSTVSGSAEAFANGVVPAGAWYRVTTSGATPALHAWTECA